MIASALATRWEARLRREGLATIELNTRRRVIAMPEVIEPARLYLPEPERLVAALEAWLLGDPSHFDEHARDMLTRRKRANDPSSRWPRRRAIILLRMSEAVVAGSSLHGARRRPGEDDLAYKYLPVLYAHLSEDSRRGDDADGTD